MARNRTIIGLACLAGMLLCYEAIAGYHDGELIHTFAAKVRRLHLPWQHGYSDGLFHGVKVNTAVEDRKDRFWKLALVQTTSNPRLFETDRFRTRFPGRILSGSPFLSEVALSFDDGPHPKTVAKLVQELTSLNVHATFFEVGKMVEKHPELVRLEAAAGNEIGNHTFSHVNLSKISETDAAIEYRACNLLLERIVRHPILYCRPPGGRSNPKVYRAAAAEGLETVLWTDDPLDYSNPGRQTILRRTLRDLEPGGIILLHEGVLETMDILPQLVAEIRDRGYQIVTVGKLMEDSRRETERARALARAAFHARMRGLRRVARRTVPAGSVGVAHTAT